MATSYQGRTTFKTTPWRMFWNVATVASLTAATIVSYVFDGLVWWTWVLIALAVLSPLAIVEGLRQRIILGDEYLEIRDTIETTRVKREDIEKVTWEKGSGAAVHISSGKWIKLPDMGHDAQGMANSVRAWHRQG